MLRVIFFVYFSGSQPFFFCSRAKFKSVKLCGATCKQPAKVKLFVGLGLYVSQGPIFRPIR